MNAENFTYWLNGFDEISNGQVPNQVQWEIIKDHLQLAIKSSITPAVSGNGYAKFLSYC